MLPELAADALRNLARHAQRTWRANVDAQRMVRA